VVETERQAHKTWFRDQRRKLRKAEKAAETLTGKELAQQQRIIAGLKRSITMGPARLGGAALKAHRTIRKRT
jgi:hypothetical protein